MNAVLDNKILCQETDRPWMEALISVTGSLSNAIEGIRRPVRQWVDDVINGACGVIDQLPTRTAGDCATVEGGKETLDLASKVGFPIPCEPILQRDFLKLEERRARLAALRESGDAVSLAAYEQECLNALTVLGFGYKPANPSDNTNIPELISTDKRGCGGIFISLSHWLGEFGLTAYACRVKEDFYGNEGHFTFIVRDAIGKFFLLDPSAHLCVTELTADLFDLEKFATHCREIDHGEESNFRLDAKNPALAYELPIHSQMVVGRIEDAKRDLLLDWTIESMSDVAAQKAALDRLHSLTGELFDLDGFPLELALKRTNFLKIEGLLDEALRETGRMFDKNPDGLITLYNVALNFLILGDVVQGLEKLHQYLERNKVVIKNLLKAILHRSKTDCARGEHVQPVLNRFDEIRDKLAARMSIITFFMNQLNQLLERSRTANFDREDHLAFVALVFNYAKQLFGEGEPFIREWMQTIELEIRFFQERTLTAQDKKWESLTEQGRKSLAEFLDSMAEFIKTVETEIPTE